MAPKTARDITQYKGWVVKHGIVIPEEQHSAGWSETEDEMDSDAAEFIDDGEEDESSGWMAQITLV